MKQKGLFHVVFYNDSFQIQQSKISWFFDFPLLSLFASNHHFLFSSCFWVPLNITSLIYWQYLWFQQLYLWCYGQISNGLRALWTVFHTLGKLTCNQECFKSVFFLLKLTFFPRGLSQYGLFCHRSCRIFCHTEWNALQQYSQLMKVKVLPENKVFACPACGQSSSGRPHT